MNNIKKALYGLFAAALLVGCSNDPLVDPETPEQPGEENTGNEAYISLNIEMPNGKNYSSRSQTITGGGSSDGIEVGSDAENTVSKLLIILANRTDYGYIASAEVNSNRLTPGKTADTYNYLALARIYKTNLNQFYEELPANTTPIVAVFVFCNPTAELVDMFAGANTTYGDKTWVDKVCTVQQDYTNTVNVNTGIWGANSFLMNNAELTYRALPNSIDDWNAFDKIDQPFHLSDANNVTGYTNLPDNSISSRGPVKVERSVARLDFRDGSENGDQKYNVLFHYHDGIMQENEPLYGVQLLRIALVNMSNAFYYLPRVSANGLATGADFTICGVEKPWSASLTGNYVVGPYWQTFGGDAPDNNFSNYFNYPFFEDDGSFANNMADNLVYDTYKITDVLQGTKDNYQSNDGTIANGSYYVWRYITENVIPAGPAKQVNGISTGIVFKSKMYGTEFAQTHNFSTHEASWEKDLINNLAKCLNGQPFETHDAIVGNPKDDPLLFYIDGQLYLSWEHLRQAAIQAACTYDATTGLITTINRSNSLYRAAFGDGPIPSYTTADGTVRQPVYIWGTSREESHPFTDPQWNSDPNSDAYKAWKASADYAWEMWDEAGRPYAPTGQQTPALLEAMRETVTGADIAIYQSDLDPEFGPGYYCYYTYWNRHNDNMQNGVMGPMEFDVVRNNVYKLSVDKISRLGHPRNPANDPDAPTPDTPDESADIYLDVTLQITPWAVRINSIEF